MRAMGFLSPYELREPNHNVDFGLRDALQLVQQVIGICDNGVECQKDSATILTILSFLIICILLIFIAFYFFREDKDEQVTPLCPQLVVSDSALTFKIALDPLAEKLDVLDSVNPAQTIAKVALDWPDPFRPCASGIASTARLQNAAGMNLATVVARNVAVSGQSLALCRSGCEIFGFVEPDTAMRYHVKHRTGVHLLTLVGDFSTWHIDGVNPAGAVVFSAKMVDGFVVGKVQQHVDAGLLICCVLAAHIHRVLQSPPSGTQPMLTPPPFIPMPCSQLMDQSKKRQSSSCITPERTRPEDDQKTAAQKPKASPRPTAISGRGVPRAGTWGSVENMTRGSNSEAVTPELEEREIQTGPLSGG